MAFGGSTLQGKGTARDAVQGMFTKMYQASEPSLTYRVNQYAAQKEKEFNKSIGSTGMFSGNSILPGMLAIDSNNNRIISSGEANQLSALSAQQAMAFSSQEAAALRDWQQNMWQQTSAYNAAEAQKNRDWQEEMSNTAYQRAMADMRAAGLNPILAYTQGGASTPGGATAATGSLSGAMGTGYSYQAMQEGSNLLKIMDFVTETAESTLNKFSEVINESGSMKNWVRKLLNPQKKGW